MMKRMILPLLLSVCVVYLCACTAASQLPASNQTLGEMGIQQESFPETKTPEVQETALPGAETTAEPEPINPLHDQTAAPVKPAETTNTPAVTSDPTEIPKIAHKPSATLTIIIPPLEPSTQLEKTPKPTAEPARTPKPTTRPTEVPLPTIAPTVKPTEPSQPEQPEPPEQPAAGYTDATHLCAAFMDAINTEKTANGAASGSLDSGLCSIAQDRARQMAEACKASHIGSGYPETVGAMGSESGVINRGRNSVHHSPQLMDCISFGVGVAFGGDGMYYYSIIGE